MIRIAHFLLYGPRNTCLGPREARSGSYRMCQARTPLPILLSTGASCSLLTYRYPLSRALILRRPVGGEIDCRVRPAVVGDSTRRQGRRVPPQRTLPIAPSEQHISNTDLPANGGDPLHPGQE